MVTTAIIFTLIGIVIGAVAALLFLYNWLTKDLDDVEADVMNKYDDSEAYNTSDITLITSKKEVS